MDGTDEPISHRQQKEIANTAWAFAMLGQLDEKLLSELAKAAELRAARSAQAQAGLQPGL